MKRIFVAAVGACLLAGSAHAFEKAGSTGAAKVPPVASRPLDLSAGKSVDVGKSGPVVRIPGLGALGVLPKLDFGLELLYGENQPQVVQPRDDEADSDGLRIRGTLKHRF